jgi:excisionase family DNA binding protein
MATPDINHENLPQVFGEFLNEFKDFKQKILSQNNAPQPQPETDRWFTIDELCEYLPDKPAKATVYGYVHTLSIPFHKTTKRLRFLKSEIDLWLKSGKRKTVSEIEAEADQYLIKRKKG